MRRRGSMVGTVLVGAVLVGLGCSGGLPEEIREFLPEPAPADPEVPGTPSTDAGTDAAGAEAAEAPPPTPEPAPPAPPVDDPFFLSIAVAPPSGAEIVESGRSRATLIHRDAWNVDAIWQGWVESLGRGGWVRYRSHEPPPFEGLFQKTGRVVDLRLKQGGPTVTVLVEVKDGALP